MIRPILAGNWKMNGTSASLGEVTSIATGIAGPIREHCTIVICPPATLLHRVAEAGAEGGILLGGQNCHFALSGAHTGDISPEMLLDAGATYVILGHSERRSDHHETDGRVRAKAETAISAGLTPIVCVGETLAERRNGVALTVVEKQLRGSMPDLDENAAIVVAYEPVWAIGTGEVPTTQEIGEIHGAIRAWLVKRYGPRGEQIAILYGGSLKPANAAEILAVENVNGGLIGGASLKAEDFLGIARAQVDLLTAQ